MNMAFFEWAGRTKFIATKKKYSRQMVFCHQNCSGDREKFLRSLEQFIQTVIGQNNFW